ncbi:MAG TPA: magnesium/cobalt transporter CorA [Coriobacteriia bacterium]
MAATAIVRWVQDDKLRVGSLADMDAAKAGTGAVWVDVSEPDEETLKALATHYPLHPLALEDMLHFPQRPKLDAYAENIFMVWVSPQLGAEQALVLSEIDVFLGADYLITSHHNHIKAIDDVAEDACGVVARGAAWTLHSILDQSVDEMFPIVDLVGEELDRIENELLAKVKDEQLQDLYKAKRVMLSLHKVVGPERDVLRAMSRHDQLVSQEAYLYLQDVGDHVARISDAIDTYRDVASSVMDIYLSAISNRLNVVMKQLTVVATIFMPLTLISGVYGMNLTKTMWPAPEWAWSFPAVIASFAVITIGMLFVFKRRGWW